jgi:hexosaminidase
MTAMEWGYEANHPFADHGARFAAAGIPFYVVPGTSSWNSILGRTDNALENLRNAAENGLRNGATGFLLTDWGDFGHWQFLPVSYGPFLYGACLSWAREANTGMDLARALDVHVFEDAAGVMGGLALDLGNTYKQSGVEVHNNTVLHAILSRYPEEPIGDTWVKSASVQGFQDSLAHIDATMARIGGHQMTCEDASMVEREFRNGAALARFACNTGIARLQAGDTGFSGIPPDVSGKLAKELAKILPEYRQLWLARNRSGGLKDSTVPLETILETLDLNAARE